MKKILTLIIPAFLLVVIIGCEDVLKDDQDNDHFIVDQYSASKAAENFLFPNPVNPNDTTPQILFKEDFILQKKVGEIKSLLNKNGQAFLHLINYVDGGFVIISGDKRMEPVLAYSEVNSFDMSESNYMNAGLITWIAQIEDYHGKVLVGEIKPFLINEHLKLWPVLIDNPIPVHYPVQFYCSSDTYYQRKMLLKTKWGQGPGYNDALDPMGCANYTNRKPPVGCVATAIAQIVKYHADNNGIGNLDFNGVPHIYFWEEMPYIASPNNPTVALTGLMKGIGTRVNMNYGCEGSGSKDGLKGLKDFTLTSSQSHGSIDYSRIINEIKQNRPVYLEGCATEIQRLFWFNSYEDCHAWVADGYSQLFNCESGFVDGQYEIHMNWGWGGSSDGWYLKKQAWENASGTYSFDFNRSMIVNIKN